MKGYLMTGWSDPVEFMAQKTLDCVESEEMEVFAHDCVPANQLTVRHEDAAARLALRPYRFS
jgi:hypothetical protein